MFSLEKSLDITLGATLFFINLGMNSSLTNSNKLDRYTKVNIGLGTSMGVLSGLLIVYRGLRS